METCGNGRTAYFYLILNVFRRSDPGKKDFTMPPRDLIDCNVVFERGFWFYYMEVWQLLGFAIEDPNTDDFDVFVWSDDEDTESETE
jgi:hypothetical protein